jgi:serine/threonine protein kinase
MAPEQIKGERGGAKSDIYAVGCLIYHLLTGEPPFTGDNPLTIMYQHMTANPKPLTATCPVFYLNIINHSISRPAVEKNLRIRLGNFTFKFKETLSVSKSMHGNKEGGFDFFNEFPGAGPIG